MQCRRVKNMHGGSMCLPRHVQAGLKYVARKSGQAGAVGLALPPCSRRRGSFLRYGSHRTAELLASLLDALHVSSARLEGYPARAARASGVLLSMAGLRW